MNQDTAKKAAKWWTEHIRNKTEFDHGEYTPQGMMAMGLANILSSAATVAGIDIDGMLPWKTPMRIEDDHIEVSVGYGSPVEILQ
jgi:hypothetical protein